MLMITYCRVEEKLILGQTTTILRDYHKCDGIIVVDEQAAADPAVKSLLSAAIPEKIKISFFGIDKGIEQMHKAETSRSAYFIILRDPLKVAEIIQKGYRFTYPIICGQQPARDDSVRIMTGLSLTDEEISAFDYAAEAGCEILLDPMSTNENIPWAKARKVILTRQDKQEREVPGSKNTSLSKSLSILDCFIGSNQTRLSLSDIQAKTQIPVSTCYRLIDFLEQNGYLTKSKKDKRYSPGWKLLLLGSASVETNRDLFLRELAPPHLRLLRDDFNETISIFVRVGPKVRCVCSVSSGHKLQVHVRENQLYDLVPDSIGLMLVSQLSAKEWKHYIDASTVTTALLKNAKNEGYSTTLEASPGGVSSISAPIWAIDGEVLGVLTMQGPSCRFSNRLEEKEKQIIAAANQLTAELRQYIGSVIEPDVM